MTPRGTRVVELCEPFRLTPEVGSVWLARRFVSAALEAAGLIDDGRVELLVGELVTNAVVHARTDVVVHAERSGRCVRVEVCDGLPGSLVIRSTMPDPTAVTGRGLWFLSSFSDRCGVSSVPVDGRTEGIEGGKCVWFEVALASPADAGGL